jgi:hypothetical protein
MASQAVRSPRHASVHRLASVLPDEAPTLHAAADEIMSLRREREAMGGHVVRDLRRVLAAWFPDHPAG